MKEVAELTMFLTLGISGMFIIFGIIMGIINRKNLSIGYRSLGKVFEKIYDFSCLIGTPIHEAGHYLMCKLFFIKVDDVKLYIPKKKRIGNRLGYVTMSPKSNLINIIGIFFVGIGPLILGSIVILLFSRLLLPDFWYGISKNTTIIELIKDFFSIKNLLNYKFWILIIISMLIGFHMDLSKSDISNAKIGFISIIIINLFVSFIIINFNVDISVVYNYIVTYNIILGTMFSLVTIFQLIIMIILFII